MMKIRITQNTTIKEETDAALIPVNADGSAPTAQQIADTPKIKTTEVRFNITDDNGQILKKIVSPAISHHTDAELLTKLYNIAMMQMDPKPTTARNTIQAKQEFSINTTDKRLE